jgi:hypothetical protein
VISLTDLLTLDASKTVSFPLSEFHVYAILLEMYYSHPSPASNTVETAVCHASGVAAARVLVLRVRQASLGLADDY